MRKNNIYVSPNSTSQGFTIDERNLHSSTEIIFPDDREIAQNLFDQVLHQPGVPTPYTFRLLHKNGQPVWVEGTLINLLHDENVKAVVSNYHDEQKEKLAEPVVKRKMR